MRAKAPLGVSASWPRWAAGFVTVTGILWLGSLFRGPGPMWGSIAAAAVAGGSAGALTQTLSRRARRPPTRLETRTTTHHAMFITYNHSITLKPPYATQRNLNICTQALFYVC